MSSFESFGSFEVTVMVVFWRFHVQMLKPSMVKIFVILHLPALRQISQCRFGRLIYPQKAQEDISCCNKAYKSIVTSHI